MSGVVYPVMPHRKRDNTTGMYAEKAPLNAVLDVFGRVRGPVITTSDVAEHFDCTTETARRKLKALHEQGNVDKRTTGRTTVWWHTGNEQIGPDERIPTEDVETAAETGQKRDQETGESTDTAADAARERDTTNEDPLDGRTYNPIDDWE